MHTSHIYPLTRSLLKAVSRTHPSLPGIEAHGESLYQNYDRVWYSQSTDLGSREGDFVRIQPKGRGYQVEFGQRIRGHGDVIQGRMSATGAEPDQAEAIAERIRDSIRVG